MKGSVLGADLRFALGAFRRQFRLSTAAALCTAIGIAATAAVVTLVDLTVLQPLPFRDADRLVRVWNVREDGSRADLSWAGYEDVRGSTRTIEQLEATGRARLLYIDERGSRRVDGEAVTAGYFEMLGVEAFAGRLFAPAEYRDGAEPVILISYAAWGTMFQHDPGAVGSTLRTNTQNTTNPRQYTIVGVLPPSFVGTAEADFPDLEFWIPAFQYVGPNLRQNRFARFVQVVGRLAEGATLEQARNELAPLSERLDAAYPRARQDVTLRAERLGDNWREGFRRGNVLLLGAAGLLLAVAAANVSVLLLARTIERRHELAVRAALGARGWQIARQLVIETAIVVAVGGVVGLLLAPILLRYFVSISALELPGYLEVSPDGGVLAVSMALIAATGLAAGLIPAVAGARTSLAATIQESGVRATGSRSGKRLGGTLAIGEIALTVVLVVCSALLARSYTSLATADLGFRTDGLLRMGLFIDRAEIGEPAELPGFYDRLRETMLAAPIVERVGLASPTLPVVEPFETRIFFPGMPDEDLENGMTTAIHTVGPEIFTTLEIPIVAGRGIGRGDTAGQPLVVVVGRSLAERMGGIDRGLDRVVGTPIRMNNRDYRVIGVAENTDLGGPAGDPRHDLELFAALYQSLPRLVTMDLIVRGDPLAAAVELRRSLAELAPTSAVDIVDDVSELMAWTYRDSRFYALLVGAFTASSLTLAAIGLFAVLANLVEASRAEIGVRRSLGATPRAILVLTLRRGLTLVGIGLAAGLALSLMAARALAGMLFGIEALDPAAFAAAAGVILLVGLVASLVPARRAATVQPSEALRG